MQERERWIVTGLVLLLIVLTLGFYVHRDPRFPGSLAGGVLGISGAALMFVPLAYLCVKRIPLLKTNEERYVLGIVLEPERVDAQQDIYSAAEVRDAAHRFMEEYRNLGLMHREILGEQVKILESYLAPAEFEVDGTRIKRGTWLLAVRVVDDELWGQIKTGALTGFSIGGSALRAPAA